MTVSEDLLFEKLANVCCDLRAKIRPLVVHRQQDAVDVERWIQARAYAAEGRHEIGKPLEGEVFAVQRDHHRFSRDERVQREQPERRRAVDEDVVEPVAKRREETAGAAIRGRAVRPSRFRPP